MKIVIVTGGFDPIHSGHIAYIKAARELGDMLIVGPNSDRWLVRKKGRAFMNYSERATILSAIEGVDHVMSYNDDCDNSTELIQLVHRNYPNDEIIFANGGDRGEGNVSEVSLQNAIPNLKFAYGIGGTTKANSSRWILEKWSHDREERPWGWYDVLKNYPGCKVKDIRIHPNHCISYQKHNHRSELWFVASGQGRAIVGDNVIHLEPLTFTVVPQGDWHQLINGSNEPLHIIEIQFGDKCEESDIERG